MTRPIENSDSETTMRRRPRIGEQIVLPSAAMDWLSPVGPVEGAGGPAAKPGYRA